MLIDYNYKHQYVGLTFSGTTSYSYTLPKSNRGIIFKNSSSSKTIYDDLEQDYQTILSSLTFLDPDNNEIIFELNQDNLLVLGTFVTTGINIVSNYFHQYPLISSSPSNNISTVESIFLNGSGTNVDEIFLPIKIKKLNFLITDPNEYGPPVLPLSWTGETPFQFLILY
jgi:hypothetical protein